MSKNEIKAIQAALMCAAYTIQHLGTKNYPHTDFEDQEIKEMFYGLNSMILKLHDKIGTIEAETV